MQCNIDARGRLARLISGIVVSIIAMIVLALAAMGTLAAWWWWLVGALLLASGGFQIFEARSGWCIMRAMGFKTPM
jgi:uncharacterized membrane protein YecN with MAPEG domain